MLIQDHNSRKHGSLYLETDTQHVKVLDNTLEKQVV